LRSLPAGKIKNVNDDWFAAVAFLDNDVTAVFEACRVDTPHVLPVQLLHQLFPLVPDWQMQLALHPLANRVEAPAHPLGGCLAFDRIPSFACLPPIMGEAKKGRIEIDGTEGSLRFQAGDNAQAERFKAVKIVGFDGVAEAFKAVKDGSFSGTVAQNPETMGTGAVDIAVQLMKGEKKSQATFRSSSIPEAIQITE
jgi:Periplasmic binding protein domain